MKARGSRDEPRRRGSYARLEAGFLPHARRFGRLSCDSSVQSSVRDCNRAICSASFFFFFVFLFKFLCLRPPLPPTTSFGSVYVKLYETEDIKAGVTTKTKKKVKITHKEVSGGKLLPDLARVLIGTQTQITGQLWTHRWSLSLSIVFISVASTPASSAAITQIPNKDGANFDNSWTEGFPPNFCLECIKRPF